MGAYMRQIINPKVFFIPLLASIFFVASPAESQNLSSGYNFTCSPETDSGEIILYREKNDVDLIKRDFKFAAQDLKTEKGNFKSTDPKKIKRIQNLAKARKKKLIELPLNFILSKTNEKERNTLWKTKSF